MSARKTPVAWHKHQYELVRTRNCELEIGKEKEALCANVAMNRLSKLATMLDRPQRWVGLDCVLFPGTSGEHDFMGRVVENEKERRNTV